MGSSSTLRKPLGVRATPEEHAILTEAAKREHRSVANFVLKAAMEAAKVALPAKPRVSAEESELILREAQALFRQSNVHGRDLVAELIAERRAEAARD